MKTKNVINKLSVLLVLLAITAGCSPWKVGAERDVVNSIRIGESMNYTFSETTNATGFSCPLGPMSFLISRGTRGDANSRMM
jgi:hypothetical protein